METYGNLRDDGVIIESSARASGMDLLPARTRGRPRKVRGDYSNCARLSSNVPGDPAAPLLLLKRFA